MTYILMDNLGPIITQDTPGTRAPKLSQYLGIGKQGKRHFVTCLLHWGTGDAITMRKRL